MGYNESPALIVVALLLFSPLAYSQLLNNGVINGQLCCTANGNCSPGSEGIPGVMLGLNCSTLLSRVGPVVQGVTGLNGGLNLTVPFFSTTIGPVIDGFVPCNIIVNLPLNSTVCPILSTTTGTLTSPISLVRTLVNGVLGLTGVFAMEAFQVVTDNVKVRGNILHI